MSTATSAPLGAEPETIQLHSEILVIDALSLYYVLDEPYAERVLEGGVNATNVTFAVEEDWPATLKNIEGGLRKIDKHPMLALATSAADILAAKHAGKLAVIMGTQGASMIEKNLSLYTDPIGSSWKTSFDSLELMHRLGLRIFGLSYTAANIFADGCGERRDAGISYYGEELIDCVNSLDMILDLSHCGHRTRWEAANRARAPMCTHSNAYGLNANDRNTKDETAKLIAEKGGVLGVCGLPRTVKAENPSLDDMLDHADYYVKLVGVEHVGLGLDFTEAYQDSNIVLPDSRRWRTLRPDIFGSVDDFMKLKYPLESIRLLPNFTQGLLDRGYSREQVASIMGGNWFRAFKDFVG
jgi:membrane dipeptidase